MAERTGGNALLAFIVGGLIVAVAVIGYMVWNGQTPAAPRPVELELKLPKAPSLPDPVPMPNPQPAPAPAPTPG